MATIIGPSELTPARRLAATWAARRRLTVPVDPLALARIVADVETIAFPGDWDGLLIRRDTGRHRIIVKAGVYEKRKRFTLAHEIGHIVLPWQVGSFSCHTELSYDYLDETTRQVEADANEFASELLVPISWVNTIAPGATPLADWVVELARRAQVSVIVAMRSSVRACPPGTLFVLTDAGKVTFAEASPGSGCPIPYRTEEFDPQVYQIADSRSFANYGAGAKAIHTFSFPPAVQASFSRNEDCTSVLNLIFDDLGLVERARVSASASINGIIGASYNELRRVEDPDEILALLVQRFTGSSREAIRDVISHKDFRAYLGCRANTVATTKPRRRKPVED